MKTAHRRITKFIIYLWLIWPFIFNIVVGILGDGFGSVIAVIILIGVTYYLEKKSILSNLIENIYRKFSNKCISEREQLTSSKNSLTSVINPVKSTISCPNCGSIVELVDGKGTCKSCDSIFS